MSEPTRLSDNTIPITKLLNRIDRVKFPDKKLLDVSAELNEQNNNGENPNNLPSFNITLDTQGKDYDAGRMTFDEQISKGLTELACLMMSRGVEVQAGELFKNKNVSLQRNVKCVNSCNKILKMSFLWG